MLNENLVILAGRIGDQLELKSTESGTKVCAFSLATHSYWIDDQTGEKKEKTTWVRCVVFGKQAETITNHFDKGSPIYIRGELSENSWEDSEGNKQSRMEIKVISFEFVEVKKAS